MATALKITTTSARLYYEADEYIYGETVIQYDWHCMAYAIFLLKQYHDGELS